jgi:choline dehydrogenase-like flavoprotein
MNSGKTIGYSEFASNTFKSERQYGPVCYAKGINVTVWTEMIATRLIIEGMKIIGVELMDNAHSARTALARKEVISSSGVQGSTKLLLLRYKFSIYPCHDHKLISVMVLVQNPSWRSTESNKMSIYLWGRITDHPALVTNWKLKTRNLSIGDVEFVTDTCDWTAGTATDFLGYHRHDSPAVEKLAKELLSASELERFNVQGRPHTETFTMYLHLDISKTNTNDPYPGGSVFTVFNILTSPTSLGSIRLSSSDPTAPPIIDPALFGSTLDKQLIYECARMTSSAIASSSIASEYGAEEYNIQESLRGRLDDEALFERLVKTCDTINHGSGTCAMGKVVDTECKVKGVESLRVVDASIFPFSIGAHYQAIVYAVAEQAADMILKEA